MLLSPLRVCSLCVCRAWTRHRTRTHDPRRDRLCRMAREAPPGSTPRDPVTRLQHEVSGLCALYTDALGNLLNEADKQLQGPPAAADSSEVETIGARFAEQVVQAHRELERQATELEHAYRPEAEQLRVLNALQARHAQVTAELRAETEAAEVAHARLSANLETLLDGVLEVNATHRAANL